MMIRFVLAAMLVASLAGCESLPGWGTSGKVVMKDGKTTLAVSFSDRDRAMIRDYYNVKRTNLPPGLAKKSRLPPGLQKQVQKNGELPPGLQRQKLPRELERKLSRLPEGYTRVVIGADVVLENGRTRIAVDVIKDIAI